MLPLDRRSIARRRAGNDANPSAGGSILARTQTSARSLPKIPKRPKIKTGRRQCPHFAGTVPAGASLPAVARQHGPSGNCAKAEIQKAQQKWASDVGAIRPAPMARIAEIEIGAAWHRERAPVNSAHLIDLLARVNSAHLIRCGSSASSGPGRGEARSSSSRPESSPSTSLGTGSARRSGDLVSTISGLLLGEGPSAARFALRSGRR